MPSFVSVPFGIFFPYTFPIDFGGISEGFSTEDGSEAVLLHWADPSLWFVYEHQSVFFQPDPNEFFEPAWLAGIGQHEPVSLMPVYDPRYIHGDIANMPYFWLSLFTNIHFGPNAGDTFQGPAAFDILEGISDFELRTPE